MTNRFQVEVQKIKNCRDLLNYCEEGSQFLSVLSGTEVAVLNEQIEQTERLVRAIATKVSDAKNRTLE